MLLFNYIAGSEFPPSLPNMFDEFRRWVRDERFCPSVVIFVLADQERDTSYQCQRLAEKLLRSQEIQGIVCSLFPENKDFLKCSRFFGIYDYPAYVIVPFPVFIMMSLMLSNNDNEWHHVFYNYRRFCDPWGDRSFCNESRHHHWYKEWYHELEYLMHRLDEKRPRFFNSAYWKDVLRDVLASDKEHRFYKIVNNTELQGATTPEDKSNLIVELANHVCNSIDFYKLRRWVREFHEEHIHQFMTCHNHFAGCSFPPVLNENKSLCLKIVVFSLKNSVNVADQLAEKLIENHKFQGLVYHLNPENRDFLKCAKFFGISTYPAYSVVNYVEFDKFLRGESSKLPYAVINDADLLAMRHEENCVNILLKKFEHFYNDGMSSILNMQDAADLGKTESLEYHTEIVVLIPTARGNHSNLDALLYEVFMKFGSLTDDVLVRILHPIFVSDEYQKAIDKYGVISLPCAIFVHKATDNIVVTMERDTFEAIPNLTGEKLRNLISDIHRAIASGKFDVAKRKAEPIKVANIGKANESALTLIFQPKTVVIPGYVEGNIIAGNSVQGG